ncbi:putative RNA binding protein [Aspergillus alliaceus]|nr:uncharacterized protein BDW43DRAFT_113422 [Aspergillus alliaceus]KAB8232337.1 hypothetical protein BDW43DRAFT_113422 [Aspergillus alliaceus]
MEVRTKEFIRTRILGKAACSRPLGRDPTILYIQHAQPKSSRSMDSPRYKIIEPRKPKRPRVPSDSTIRTSSPIRSRPLRFRFALLGRIGELEQEPEPESEVEWESNSDTDTSTVSNGESTCRPRGRDKSRRRFVVHKPDDEIRIARRTVQSSSPKLQSTRSRTKFMFESDNGADAFDISSRYPRSRQLSRGARKPRERTPVSDREPSRRGPRIVKIHNDHRASPCEKRAPSPGRHRRVRFASDVEYVKNTNRARDSKVSDRERERYHVESRHHHSPSIGGLNNNYGSGNSGATCRVRTPERTFSEHARPRIIQDGKRQMSEAAERIRKEAWRQHTREGLLRNFKSYSGRCRCTRRSDERIIYGGSNRQYDCS